MFSNLNGWHLVILLVVLLIIVLAIAGVVFVAVALARRGRSKSDDIGSRIRAIDRLRDNGQLSDAEYQAKREEILRQL